MTTADADAEHWKDTVSRLTLGWYWRQDTDFRFLEVGPNIAKVVDSPDTWIGRTRWERPNLMPDAFWRAHREQLQTHRAFSDLEYECADPAHAGRTIWIRISGEPLRDAQGRFAGYHGFGWEVTAAKSTELELRHSEARFRDFAASLSDWLWETDEQLNYIWLSESILRVTGKPAESFLGQPIDRWHYEPGTDLRAAQEVQRALQRREPFSGFVFRTNDPGHPLWISKSGVPYFDAQGRFRGYRGVNRDVSLRHHSEAALREREQRFATIFQQSPVGIVEWDAVAGVQQWNAAAERIFGWTREEMMGQPARKLMPSQLQPQLDEIHRALMDGHQQQQSVMQNQHKDGRVLICSWFNSAVRDAQGQPVGILSIVEDVTAQKVTAERIEHLARHDALTQLPNRAYLMDLLEAALEEARGIGRPLAVMVVNMDRFKLVNDALGHTVGDQLLHSVAQRLRETVPPDSTVARLGGDEFAIVLRDDGDANGAQELGEKLRRALALPHRIDRHDVPCTPSIGVALYPLDGTDALALLGNADAAMTRAKALGRNNMRFFSASLRQAVAEQLELEFDLRQAQARCELLLHYQPQVDAMTGAMVGAEALLRWNHPVRGLIGPATFIPIAESSGLIVDIGAWVLDEACRQLRQWHDQGLKGVTMAVNLSAHQLRDASLVPHVARVLHRHGLQGGDLELELTESMAMEDPDATIEVLQQLRELGVQLSIDDFGTGYSSLSYLKLLPIHRLKLDRSFVKDIETDPNDAAICSATIALAHKLKLTVVAEGVETELQRNYLLGNGCDYLQGYLFSAPATAPEIAQFAAMHRRATGRAVSGRR
ncbi:MAG TPA: EAL domain-containing protein [Burkholderiaceae bacterium]|nr:EAL domain-containing protein [Burkholderiaceae bacterium]